MDGPGYTCMIFVFTHINQHQAHIQKQRDENKTQYNAKDHAYLNLKFQTKLRANLAADVESLLRYIAVFGDEQTGRYGQVEGIHCRLVVTDSLVHSLGKLWKVLLRLTGNIQHLAKLCRHIRSRNSTWKNEVKFCSQNSQGRGYVRLLFIFITLLSFTRPYARRISKYSRISSSYLVEDI